MGKQGLYRVTSCGLLDDEEVLANWRRSAEVVGIAAGTVRGPWGVSGRFLAAKLVRNVPAGTYLQFVKVFLQEHF